MLKLNLQYFGQLMRTADSLGKILMLGKIEGRSKGGWQRMKWLDGIINSMDMSLSKLWRWLKTGKPGVLQSMGSQRVGHDLVTGQQYCFCFVLIFWSQVMWDLSSWTRDQTHSPCFGRGSPNHQISKGVSVLISLHTCFYKWIEILKGQVFYTSCICVSGIPCRNQQRKHGSECLWDTWMTKQRSSFFRLLLMWILSQSLHGIFLCVGSHTPTQMPEVISGRVSDLGCLAGYTGELVTMQTLRPSHLGMIIHKVWGRTPNL